MDLHLASSIVITRVSQRHWHALADDEVIGRGEVLHRPDGRIFLSVDVWDGIVFDQLTAVMLADLPRPLYTVVDEADTDLVACWQAAGFAAVRKEWDFEIPTDLEAASTPAGVTIVGAGRAEVGLLQELDKAIRAEVAAGIGWQAMPAEILPRPEGITAQDVPRYVVAAQGDRYVGMIRLAMVTRRPRIGLLAVRAGHQRQGIGRALLAHALGALHRNGISTALAEVDESNTAAMTLFEGVGGKRISSSLELSTCQEQ